MLDTQADNAKTSARASAFVEALASCNLQLEAVRLAARAAVVARPQCSLALCLAGATLRFALLSKASRTLVHCVVIVSFSVHNAAGSIC